MQLKKQDEGLEMLSMSASRLGELSMNIHTELEDQNRYVKLFSLQDCKNISDFKS